jgi:Protein of unknown function (DUF3313)
MKQTLSGLGWLLTVFVAMTLASGVLYGADVRKIEMESPEGLSLVRNEKHSVVYVNKAVDWASYRTFQVEQPNVAFRKNWQRDQNMERPSAVGRVTEQDVQRIKSGLSEMLKATLESQLVEKGGLGLTDKVGIDTLILKPSIIKLDVYAPDTLSAGSSKTYVERAGEGTLYLEIFDGVSGDLLARILDYRRARDNGYFEWATRVSNRRDAQRIIDYWADRLVEALDNVRASTAP